MPPAAALHAAAAAAVAGASPGAGPDIAPLTVWSSSAWPALGLAAAPRGPLNFTAFDAAMERASGELDGLGIAAVAFDQAGQQILSRTYGRRYCKTARWCDGFRDAGALTVDTPLPIFSNSKIVSVSVFLAAVGMAGLDVPLRASLPDIFAAPGAHAGDATPRMIFSHTGGFVGINDPRWLNDTDCFNRYNCHARYDPGSNITLEQCVRQIARRPLVALPGTEWIYSDWGFDIIALVVERAAGLRFEDAFQQLLARPLGLASSTYECREPGSSAAFPHPATGLCTTAGDMGRVMRMLLRRGEGPGGGAVLPPAAVRQILTPQTGYARRNQDAPFFDCNLFGSRCVNAASQASSNIDYGFGVVHHLGFKSEAWAHGSHLGSSFFIAPSRFAFYFATAFPGGSVDVVPRCLRAVDAFEEENEWVFRGPSETADPLGIPRYPIGEAAMGMCPTSIELRGDVLQYGFFNGTAPEFGPDGRLLKPNC